MKLSKFEIKALTILVNRKEPVSAGIFAQLYWPDSPSWHRYSNVGHGATTAVGIKQAAGSHLHRLWRKGLVQIYWPEHGCYSLWVISEKGRKALEENVNDS